MGVQGDPWINPERIRKGNRRKNTIAGSKRRRLGLEEHCIFKKLGRGEGKTPQIGGKRKTCHVWAGEGEVKKAGKDRGENGGTIPNRRPPGGEESSRIV